jgi:hypothetical protein
MSRFPASAAASSRSSTGSSNRRHQRGSYGSFANSAPAACVNTTGAAAGAAYGFRMAQPERNKATTNRPMRMNVVWVA